MNTQAALNADPAARSGFYPGRVDVYSNPLARARVEELMQLTKAALIAQARLPRLNIHGSLEKWRKVELAWTITRAEFALADRPHQT